MTRIRRTFGWIAAGIAGCCGTVSADESGVVARLEKEVAPLLEKYCIDCHDGEVRKADIDLGTVRHAKDGRLDVKLWDKVEEQLRLKQMPPAKKPQPSEDERAQLMKWIADAEAVVAQQEPTDPGYRKARRLTRQEYSLSLRDLLGTTTPFGDAFPADGAGGEGFDRTADTLMVPALLIEKYLEAADAALTEVWQKPELVERLVETRPAAGVTATAAAKANLERLARGAYRRPVTEEDVNPLAAVFDHAQKRGADFEAALKVALKAMLMSPKFLILQEEDRPAEQKAWKVTSVEMAVRLSYFLWSSVPDEELARLAEADRLQEPAVIEAQVKRMLADAKAKAFVESFAGQWLGLPELFNTVDPDRRKYPAFTPSLRQAMYDEGVKFCDAILRGNGRVLDFIHSDYTFANEELAKFYEIPGVAGGEFRRVALPDARRGGLLGMGAILATTAYPQRTSVVLRGKWVLEQLMGTPAPPPPANVGSLPEDDRKLQELTFRQQLEKHRSKEQCMGCHNRLDPPGFGLENFDPIGRWRESENGKALDVRGSFLDGRGFDGPAEMRQVLMADKAKFVRNFCSRLLGYALERGLETADQPTLMRLEETLVKADYRSLPVIVAVAQSFPFTHRRNSRAETAKAAGD